MEDYKPARKDSRVFNRRVRNRIVNLAVQLEESADAGEFQDHVVDFYREFGVGNSGSIKHSASSRGRKASLLSSTPLSMWSTYILRI